MTSTGIVLSPTCTLLMAAKAIARRPSSVVSSGLSSMIRVSLFLPLLLAYLCVSLRHMIVNELKKENSGSLKSLDEVGTSEYQFDLEIDIETAIIRSELEKEQLEVLQKELNNLTKQQREVLYLKYYKKMSSEEIAQVMGLTSRTVYNTTHMAISSLRERMSKSFLLLVAANLWIFN